MSLRGKLRLVGQTDTGKVREHNEDTIAFDPDIGLLVLADGMGGNGRDPCFSSLFFGSGIGILLSGAVVPVPLRVRRAGPEPAERG